MFVLHRFPLYPFSFLCPTIRPQYKAPEGHEHWTMQMLADKLVMLGVVEGSLSDETVRLRLQKTT